MEGYITVHRKIREWEWYKVPNTKGVFLEIMLTANIKDQRYRGSVIPRGSLITTMADISQSTGLTKDEVRTALKNLKTSHTISHTKLHNKMLINILNYDEYQLGKENDPTHIPTRTHTHFPHGSHTVPTPYIEEKGKEGKKDKNKPPVSPINIPYDFTEPVRSALADWFQYKAERKEKYKDTGLSNFFTIVRNHTQKHGARNVADIIRYSMANDWQGVLWKKIGADEVASVQPAQGEPAGVPELKPDLHKLDLTKMSMEEIWSSLDEPLE